MSRAAMAGIKLMHHTCIVPGFSLPGPQFKDMLAGPGVDALIVW